MKSKVTQYDDICFFCGRPAECTHHLIFGVANRKLCDADGLFVPICAKCHKTDSMYPLDILERIHDNSMAEKLSKMLGQAMFERNYYKDLWYQLNRDTDEARKVFIERYGRSYL